MSKFGFMGWMLTLHTALTGSVAFSMVFDEGFSLRADPIVWFDESDEELRLSDIEREGKPIVLVPVYTHCPTVCPVIVGKTKAALMGLTKPVSVVVFSFDPEDDAEALKEFRDVQSIDEEWHIVGATLSDSRSFFAKFGYSIMKQDEEFVHPSQIYVLAADGVKIADVREDDLTAKNIQAAVDRAYWYQKHPTWASMYTSATHPDNLAMYGVVGLLGMGAFFLWAVPRHSRKAGRPT